MNYQEALGWALVHFLWQGAAIAAVTAAVLRGLRRPEARYAACCVGLAAMMLAPMATIAVRLAGPAGETVRLEGSRLQLAIPPEAVGSFDTWLPTVTLAWAVGACLLLLRSAGGWWWAWKRSKADRVRLEPEWLAQVERLRVRMGVTDRVAAYASVSSLVPHVFGWWRPVLLLPVCALANMTPEMVEALIAHELAHVRRRDYLVNLLQTVVESLLFYHPAVWWVSARARQEREMCCDEAAVAACGDRVLYSTALLRLEEARLEFAMAASGTGLKERIGRVLGMEERKNGISLIWPAAALLVCGGLLYAQWDPPAPPEPPAPPAPVKVQAPPAPPVPAAPVVPPAPVVAGVVGGVPGGVVGGVPGADAAQSTDQIRKEIAEVNEQIAELEAHRAELARQLAGQGEDMAAQKAEMEKMSAKLRAEMGAQRGLRDRELKERLRAQAQLTDQERLEAKRAAEAEMANARLEKEMAEAHGAPADATQQAELERRTKLADRKWGSAGVRGSETAKGKFYVQHGPPDTIQVTGEGETWTYQRGLIAEFGRDGKLKSVKGDI